MLCVTLLYKICKNKTKRNMNTCYVVATKRQFKRSCNFLDEKGSKFRCVMLPANDVRGHHRAVQFLSQRREGGVYVHIPQIADSHFATEQMSSVSRRCNA